MNCTPERCPHRALMEKARAACFPRGRKYGRILTWMVWMSLATSNKEKTMQNRRDFLKSAMLAGAACSAVNGLKAEAAATGPAGARE